jgi:hypothetical protein
MMWSAIVEIRWRADHEPSRTKILSILPETIADLNENKYNIPQVLIEPERTVDYSMGGVESMDRYRHNWTKNFFQI